MSLRTTFRLGTAAVLLAASWGCSDEIAAPNTGSSSAAPRAVTTAQQQDAEVLARTIARSLDDPALRRRLLEDLRDSPNPQHALHLKSYLGGADGGLLLDAGAGRVERSRQELRALLRDLPEMELVVTRASDRASWTGSGDLAVFGTTESLAEVAKKGGALHGYNPAGEPVRLGVFEAPSYVIVMLRPAEASFGADPEAVRAAVADRLRSTISRREVEFSLDPSATDPECSAAACRRGGKSPGEVTAMCLDDPSTEEIECEPTEPQPTPTAGKDMGFSYGYCASPSGDDADQDGIRDGCEQSLALTFAPLLRISAGDQCPVREPYWAAALWSGRPNAVKVMYLVAYHEDCPNTALWPVGNTGHKGDSEWIIVTMEAPSATDPNRWTTYSVTTSAHYRETSDATQTTSAGSWPSWRAEYKVAPVVFVALDKHANYKSWSDCENGAYGYDSCPGPTQDAVVEISEYGNIGNNWATPTAVRLKHEVRSIFTPITQTEYIWGTHVQRSMGGIIEYFCGWQASGPCASGYAWPVYDFVF
ncbi:MAG: hypothetical protein AB1941_21785 [Gemmatimonadota bacterium]